MSRLAKPPHELWPREGHSTAPSTISYDKPKKKRGMDLSVGNQQQNQPYTVSTIPGTKGKPSASTFLSETPSDYRCPQSPGTLSASLDGRHKCAWQSRASNELGRGFLLVHESISQGRLLGLEHRAWALPTRNTWERPIQICKRKLFFALLNCGKTYIIKFTTLTISSVWFSVWMKYIHRVMQLPPLSISRTFSPSKQKPHSH